MTLGDYIASLSGKKVAVLGVGVSNRPLCRVLASGDADITAYDRRDAAALGEFADELRSLGIALSCGEGYLDNLDADVIFRTPGMRPDLPQLTRAVLRGAQLTSEMEVFFKVCPCPVIAVTGSDGKSTTSTLIYEMLRRSGRSCYLGGNIGRPLLAYAGEMRPDDFAVVELSSFQLMTMRESADISVVTNVTPNHLDIHRDMEEYIEAKRNVFAHQTGEGRIVLNFDNDITRDFARSAPGRVVPFSKTPDEPRGVYLKDGAIWVGGESGACEVLTLSDILLPGIHNAENYMAAIGAVWGIATPEAIRETAREFPGVEHRIEFVREIRGVRFYNDSIATSPTRVIAGLNSFPQKLIVIAGGYDKHLSFEPLARELITRAKGLVLCGATAGVIRAAVESEDGYSPETLPIITEAEFNRAVESAYSLAAPGDVVILSPACAAFDMFQNFEARGRVFKNYVNSLE